MKSVPTPRWRHRLPVLLLAVLLIPVVVLADDDDDAPAPASTSALPSLNAAQQQAVGVVVGHPVAAAPASRTEAYARVLDPSSLIADAGRLDSTRAAAHAADTELDRLQKLYHGDAGASLKAVEHARAAQVEARVQARAAVAEFALRWGPLAGESSAQRQALLEALTAGHTLLLRADLPGRHSLGEVPTRAVLQVDGVGVPARVLGPLSQSAPELQSVGLLLRADHVPAGLGSGARLPATLEGAPNKGWVVPDGALLYGDKGAYVYRRLPAKAGDGATRFAPVDVRLLQPVGDGWLVQGIDGDDAVVMHGAGVLWSLQGLGNVSEDDDD